MAKTSDLRFYCSGVYLDVSSGQYYFDPNYTPNNSHNFSKQNLQKISDISQLVSIPLVIIKNLEYLGQCKFAGRIIDDMHKKLTKVNGENVQISEDNSQSQLTFKKCVEHEKQGS